MALSWTHEGKGLRDGLHISETRVFDSVMNILPSVIRYIIVQKKYKKCWKYNIYLFINLFIFSGSNRSVLIICAE